MKKLVFIFVFFLLSCSGRAVFQSLGSEEDSFQTSSFSGTIETEEFVLNDQKALVDFGIIIDSSESMYHHLRQLGRSLADLLFFIEDYAWQIAITSADHGDHQNPLGLQQSWKDHISVGRGKFGGLMELESETGYLNTNILTPKTPDYQKVFFHTLSHENSINCNRPPYCQARLEQPLRSLKSLILRAQVDNSLLFRPGADFIALIVGNEEERTEDRKRATTAQQVIDVFHRVFGHLNKKFIAFNILVTTEDCATQETKKGARASIGRSIMELADKTGGYNISICSQNYGQELKRVSKHIRNSLQNSVVLKKDPIPETVSVKFSGKEMGWELYGRQIFFERSRFSSNTSVSVTYESWE